MKVAVIGTGYVGLVSGVCLSAKGHDVTCVDVNDAIVASLNEGRPHIHERDLPELLSEVIAEGRFRATTDLSAALESADLVIVAVGTPSADGVIDLRFILTAVGQIGDWLCASGRFLPVIIKSTVVPGTTDGVVLAEIEKHSGLKLGDFGLGMNPEFLREGEAVDDFLNPDRIVLGHEDEATLRALKTLYAPWDCDKLAVSTRTAEMIKYTNNAILAVQISAMNELANVATRLGGIDMRDVVEGVSLDRRWSPIVDGTRIRPGITTYLVPGCGFGGSCFPKDVQAIRSLGETTGLPMHMLNGVLKVNENQPHEVVRILEAKNGSLRDANVLLLGLAFKPGTDDVRETASLPIIRDMINAGAVVTAHDPIAIDGFKSVLGDDVGKVRFVDAWEPELPHHDIVVIATRWDEYRRLAGTIGAGKTVFDIRRLLSPRDVGDANYLTIGRSERRQSA
ncbi:MAG: UDP-glucose/GDP-mannose dehydrogenase family protein [Sphingomonas sp.]|jgi:UDPglucose 6-dehydrogenase/GDP-mannose 6-dehydrogenase